MVRTEFASYLDSPYQGFTWGNTGKITSVYYAPYFGTSGYTNTIEGHVGIVTAYANAITMGGRLFSLYGAKVGAAWNDNQYVTFAGYRGGTLVASERFSPSYFGETHAFFGFVLIDSLVITPDISTGTWHPGAITDGHHIVLDNISVEVGRGTLLDFEDLWSGTEFATYLDSPYQGFTWGNTGKITSAYYAPYLGTSGYTNTIEGHVGIVTAYANAITMGGRLFSLYGAKVGAAWNDNQYVTFAGYRGGTLVASERFSPSYFGETHAFFGFVLIDSLVITPDISTGTWHPGAITDGHHIVLDNILVTDAPAAQIVAQDVSGHVGETVSLTATLAGGASPLAGQLIAFAVGAWSASAITGADGVASVSYAIVSAGDQAVTATFAGNADWAPATDDATLTGILNPTTLVATDVSGNVGQTVQLSATLTDGTNPLDGETVDFTIGAWSASATTDGSGVAAVSYTIPAMGDKTIEVSYAGTAYWAPSADEATLSVYNNVTGVGLFLSANPVTAGQATTATVVDQAGNIITDKCVLQIQSGAGGSWAGQVYTSAKVGTWTVTANYGPLGDTADLVVTPGAVTAVDISPDAATITAAGAQSYTVQVSDGCGNTRVPEPAEITWTHDGAGGFSGNTYTADAADAGKTLDIQATVAGVQSDRSALTVTAAGGAGLVLAWDKDTCGFYLCANPADPQTGAPIPGVNGGYVVNGVAVLVSGSTGNRTVAVQSTSGPSNTLQVRWYVRGGVVSNAYMYSTIDGVRKTASYGSGRTFVDGSYKVGFFSLTHTLDAADPATITYGAMQQP